MVELWASIELWICLCLQILVAEFSPFDLPDKRLPALPEGRIWELRLSAYCSRAIICIWQRVLEDRNNTITKLAASSEDNSRHVITTSVTAPPSRISLKMLSFNVFFFVLFFHSFLGELQLNVCFRIQADAEWMSAAPGLRLWSSAKERLLAQLSQGARWTKTRLASFKLQQHCKFQMPQAHCLKIQTHKI